MYTLVDGTTYLVAGDPHAAGLYHGDTRHLSPLSVDVDGADLALVDDRRRPPRRRTRRYASAGTPINEISETVDGKHARVLFERRQTVAEGRLVERFEVHNHSARARRFDLVLEFDADFVDIFEVRGLEEPTSRAVTAAADGREITFAYEYADRSGAPTTLETAITFDAAPSSLDPGRVTFALSPGPQASSGVTVEVVPGGNESTVRWSADGRGADGRRGSEERVDPFAVDAAIETGVPDYDRAFERAREDVSALTTRTAHGPVPLAGAPWFLTVFGRDALLASYLLLPVAPALARGSLRFLAAHRGTEYDARRDEAPGKVLHEIRSGELARTGAIPQVPYYGSIDATPLWVTLLHETWRWTGDDALVSELWEPLGDALDWLEEAVAATGADEFLYYRSLGRGGVSHKVWRDSANGVQYADGGPAEPPLASAAVQGYLHDALRRAADLAASVPGDDDLADDLAARATAVAERFDDAFWLPDREFYAPALTPAGRPVDSITSTIGHCLWSGIVPDDRAEAVADRLLAPDLMSRWGLRTLGAEESGYSPLSYHAGGVWPHDNALAALGLARYGHDEAAATIAVNQFDALSRLGGTPELFCGFDDPAGPVPYPSACRPQAWAAAAPYGFLRAQFGLGPDVEVSDERTGPLAASAVDPVIAYWR